MKQLTFSKLSFKVRYANLRRRRNLPPNLEQANRPIAIPDDVPPKLANFCLIKEIGRGGMGVVWLAEQDKPVKRRVALKLIKSELTSKDVLARFGAEKQAMAMMEHPCAPGKGCRA